MNRDVKQEIGCLNTNKLFINLIRKNLIWNSLLFKRKMERKQRKYSESINQVKRNQKYFNIKF